MRKTAIVMFILALLITVAVGILHIELATANPHPFPLMGDIPPDENTKPPKIEILNSIVDGNSVCVDFIASIGESTTAEELRIIEVYYKPDWNQSNHYVFRTFDSNGNIQNVSWVTEFSYKLNVTEIPEGTHTITIFACELGAYYLSGYTYLFNSTGYSPVNFTIKATDVTMPKVSPSQNPTLTPYQSDSATAVVLGFDWLQVATLVLLGAIVVLLIVVVIFLQEKN